MRDRRTNAAETRSEHEKRRAHALIDELDADAITLISWRQGEPSVHVSNVVHARWTPYVVRIYRSMADALRLAAVEIERMAADWESKSKH